MYDKNNIFAKIINKEIPAEISYEDDILIVIKDLNPAAETHLLVIPKKTYTDYSDFVSNAPESDIIHYFKKIDLIASQFGAEEYRLVSNKGKSSGQSVFHFHTHILSKPNNLELTDTNL